MEEFDYVIAGAGSAGCVLANRLSANPSVSVLLIEGGPRDASPYIQVPRGFAKLMADPAGAAGQPQPSLTPHPENR